MREKQLNIRLNKEEAARLLLVADHYGLNGAAVFRMLLKREADNIGKMAEAAAIDAHLDEVEHLDKEWRKGNPSPGAKVLRKKNQKT